MLVLVGISVAVLIPVTPNRLAGAVLDHGATIAEIEGALGADNGFADLVPTVWLVAALAVHDDAIGVGKLDVVVVENLAGLAVGAGFAATHALGGDGVGVVHEPVDHVDVMNVLLEDVVATNPCEMIPVLDLVIHFRPFRLAVDEPDAGTVPITLGGHDVPDETLLDLFLGGEVVFLIAALETYDHFEVLLFCLFRIFKNHAAAGGIGGDGFFHEDMFACLDGSLEHEGPEARRGGEDDRIGVLDGFLIGFQSHEFAVVRDVDFGSMLGLQGGKSGLQAVRESVGHSHHAGSATG